MTYVPKNPVCNLCGIKKTRRNTYLCRGRTYQSRCKKCHNHGYLHYDKPEYRRVSKDRSRFGGMREVALQRDNYTCVDCGMTDYEHQERWGRGITVDHIDGQGRYSETQNNELSNLATRCLSCHGRKDRLLYLSGRREAGSRTALAALCRASQGARTAPRVRR